MWLLHAPPCVNATVWAMVCVAAVHAMEHGRRVLWARSLSVEGRGLPRSVLVSSVAALVVAQFWLALYDFAGVRPAAPLPLAADHPFLCVMDGVMVVNLPMA